MNVLKQLSSLRIVSCLTTSLLCVLLASAITPGGASNKLLKKKPSVELQASTTLITYPCPPSGRSASGSCPATADFQVALRAVTKTSNKQSVYSYTVTGGRVVGEDSKVIWDLSGAWPGSYTATVEVKDKKKHRASSSVTVKLVPCPDCVACDLWCPTIVVSCYDEVKIGTPITCKAVVEAARPSDPITYEWSARDSSGEDLSGRINGRGKSISIPTDGLGGKNVTATVELKGLDPSCSGTASGSTTVKP